MSKLTELFRSVKIYNDYEFFRDEPHMWYRPQGDARSMMSSAWMVTKHGTNLEKHWSDRGSYCILVWGRHDKQERFEEAALYMYTQFGIEELARSPFGGWGDKQFVKRRIAEIKEMAK